jgi:hypothetical protein
VVPGYSVPATPLLMSPMFYFLIDVWNSNPESCCSKHAHYQLCRPISLISHPSPYIATYLPDIATHLPSWPATSPRKDLPWSRRRVRSWARWVSAPSLPAQGAGSCTCSTRRPLQNLCSRHLLLTVERCWVSVPMCDQKNTSTLVFTVPYSTVRTVKRGNIEQVINFKVILKILLKILRDVL